MRREEQRPGEVLSWASQPLNICSNRGLSVLHITTAALWGDAQSPRVKSPSIGSPGAGWILEQELSTSSLEYLILSSHRVHNTWLHNVWLFYVVYSPTKKLLKDFSRFSPHPAVLESNKYLSQVGYLKTFFLQTGNSVQTIPLLFFAPGFYLTPISLTLSLLASACSSLFLYPPKGGEWAHLVFLKKDQLSLFVGTMKV